MCCTVLDTENSAGNRAWINGHTGQSLDVLALQMLPECRRRLVLKEAAAHHRGCWPHGGHCLCPWIVDLPACLGLASEMEGGPARGGSLPLGQRGPIQERRGLLGAPGAAFDRCWGGAGVKS